MQQIVPEEPKPRAQSKRVLWPRLLILGIGLTLIGTAIILYLYNQVFGAITLGSLALLVELFQYVVPIPMPSSNSIHVAVTVQPPSLPLSSAPSVSNWQQQAATPLWNVPYLRNPYFIGRERILLHLHETLTGNTATALTQRQTLSGLGGVGKTQIAIEYAYRHRDAYRFILWINAVTRDTIIASFLELAILFDLPQQREPDQSIVVAAVKQWFTTHSQWLLIFDNADDLLLVREFLPTSETGHLLLTTRNQTIGTLGNSIDTDTLDTEQGMSLLLRRAKVLPRDRPLDQARPEDRNQAKLIVEELGGLPLALDQAAAYIEETNSDLATYREQYHQRRDDLLRRRGETNDHPLPVTATWSLSFTQVQLTNPRAADLLRVCAFLAPDTISEEMIREGAAELGPLLAILQDRQADLNEAIGVLRRFSLVQRNREDHTLSIHRLVQAALQLSMDELTLKTWAERTIRAVNRAFPNTNYSNWSQCERLLPHALVCAKLIETYALAFPEAALLLVQTGYYLYQRGQYGEVEPLYQQAVAIREQVLGPEHPDTAQSLNYLGWLYHTQGKYAEAEPLLQRALAICKRVLGPTHPTTKAIRANYQELLQRRA